MIKRQSKFILFTNILIVISMSFNLTAAADVAA